MTIKIGSITITECGIWTRINGDETPLWEISVEGEKYPLMISATDIRLVILEALGYEAFGLNSDFGMFTSRMLGASGDILRVG